MNKKWVELFEKVIGRKPTPEEFIAGRDSGFDFKAIKSIAGVAIDQVASEASALGGQGPVEAVVNPLQLAWEERFIALYGRSPLPEEIESARSQNFEIVEAPAPTINLKRPIRQPRSSHQWRVHQRQQKTCPSQLRP